MSDDQNKTTRGEIAVPHMDELRGHLMETLSALRDRANPMDVERAKAVAQVASVLVDTAKVEVDFLKVTGGDRSRFLGSEPAHPALPSGYTGGRVERLPNGVTRHKAA